MLNNKDNLFNEYRSIINAMPCLIYFFSFIFFLNTIFVFIFFINMFSCFSVWFLFCFFIFNINFIFKFSLKVCFCCCFCFIFFNLFLFFRVKLMESQVHFPFFSFLSFNYDFSIITVHCCINAMLFLFFFKLN